jgi:hypothetical protein
MTFVTESSGLGLQASGSGLRPQAFGLMLGLWPFECWILEFRFCRRATDVILPKPRD